MFSEVILLLEYFDFSITCKFKLYKFSAILQMSTYNAGIMPDAFRYLLC